MEENPYICTAMKIERHNWVVRCLVACLALVCWNRADALVLEKFHETDSRLEIMASVATCVEEDVEFLSPLELTGHSCTSASARTLAKSHRQNTTKHSRHGFALFRWDKFTSELVISLNLNSALRFPLGLDESKPLFICLRKLIL